MPNTQQKNRKKRNKILLVLTLLLATVGLGYFYYYNTYGQFSEHTDNAYVKQDIVYVTPQVSGIVNEVNVKTTQHVNFLNPLGHLDTTDIKITFEKSKNDLAQTVRSIKQLYRRKEEAKAAISLAKVQLSQTQEDLKMRKSLMKSRSITQDTYSHYRHSYEEALKNMEVFQKKYASLAAMLEDENISQNPKIQKAALILEQNYINLKRCDILAPRSGTVAKKNFSVGNRVTTQTILLAIVPEKGFWVDANFKETQLKNIRIGQPVKLYSDIYGKEVIFHGTVEGISAGTGSVFSLLPAQNATGNWIKIVQRIPVKIKLDQNELKKHPLVVGSSMDTTVNTHQRDAQKPQTLKSVKSGVNANLYQNAITEAQKIAKKIIKQNL